MTREEILAYVNRDWAAVEAAKLADWAARKREMSAEQALELAGALAQDVRSRRPDWPSVAERDADLAAHVELSRTLGLVDPKACR